MNAFPYSELKVTEATTLLQAMLMRGAPPPDFENEMVGIAQYARMDLNFAQTVRKGVRLRAWLPAYLIQWRDLLDANCHLLQPFQLLVSSYEEPTTTEEFWATGLGERE
jgi:hypothetical protein